MEYFYTAYTKQIADKNYYFIKRYMVFPELKNAAQILDGYGMHPDFQKACHIAGISKSGIRENLWAKVSHELPTARIIQVNFPVAGRPKKFVLQNLLWRFPLARLKFRF